jgi:diguanylate cyclase (GGDEF)-like protein
MEVLNRRVSTQGSGTRSGGPLHASEAADSRQFFGLFADNLYRGSWGAMRKIFDLRVRIAVALVAFVLLPSMRAQRQLFHEYGASDGLNNLNVRCLLQDRTGYIWVGTDNGLFRYDGGKFISYGHADGLSNTEILSLGESPQGKLWVGTNDGVAIRSGDRFQVVDVGQQGATRRIGFDAAGRIYLQHDAGILRGVPTDSSAYRFNLAVSGAVTGLFVHGDEIWFAQDGGLWRLKADNAQPLPTSLGLPRGQWDSMIQDSLGNAWVRSATQLFELPRGRSRFVDRSQGIPHAVEAAVYADLHGRVFVPTISGITVLSGTHRSVIDANHGLPADPSGPMLIDREELLWMGSNGGGLIRRLGHGEWVAWTERDGLIRNSVWAIQTDHLGNVWVGSNGGLTRLGQDGRVSHSWTHLNGLGGDRVLSIIESPAGDFFAGTDASSISRFSPQGTLVRNYGTESGYLAKRVSAMAFDREGRLWAIGIGGCFRSHSSVGRGQIHFDRMDIPGLPENSSFRDIVVDSRNTVWIASSRGLAHFDRDHWRVFTTPDGLRSSDLGVVAEAQGAIWIGYRDALGMSRLQAGGNTITHVSMENGLHSDQVYAIAPDHKGRLWVTTDSGVDVLDAGKWKHYGNEDGLIWNDTDSLALHVDSEDNVWIGTSGGLSRFAQPDFPMAEQPPPVVLTSVADASQRYQAGDAPAIAYGARSLFIQYAALAYEAGSALRFRYRLAGLEQNWTETSERSVHFAALPPGHYIFEVTAMGPNGLWNSVPARFIFSIRPPWWLTWWFISALILLAILVGSVLLQLRIRVLEAQKAVLEDQVADRTAELRASHQQLEEIAYCDMLTNTSNRRMFVEKLRRRLLTAGRSEPFTLLLIDLDFFKHVNDSFGHDAGDAVLVETAARIKAEVHHSDCVARLGGDEFAVLLCSVSGFAATEALCKRLLKAMAAPIQYKDLNLQVGCSIGIARYPHEGDSQETLYKCADNALYHAKQRGRNAYCWHGQQVEKVVVTSVN